MGSARHVARLLRRHATAAERGAWQLLRGRRMFGLKFRRQYPLAGFFVDFYCVEHKLVIELDGSVHRTPVARASDREREAILRGMGCTVIRITNERVSHETLARAIRTTLDPSRRSPLP